jgi:hypothetical protein
MALFAARQAVDERMRELQMGLPDYQLNFQVRTFGKERTWRGRTKQEQAPTSPNSSLIHLAILIASSWAVTFAVKKTRSSALSRDTKS